MKLLKLFFITLKLGPAAFALILCYMLLNFTGCEVFRQLLPVPDRPNNAVQKPVITELFASAITNNTAIISWRTQKPAGSKVNYGTSVNLGSEVIITTQTVVHNVSLSSLNPGTTYYYKAASFDPLGNSVVSSVQTFITESLGIDSIGPQVSGLSASPNPNAGASSITVSAVVSDAATGNSNVTAAECFFDNQGANGTGAALSALDGGFDSVTENVSGSILVTGLSLGNHTLLVHGRDAANNWGPIQSISLTISASAGDTTGPVTSGLSLTPNPTAGAAIVTITAAVSDISAGGSNIIAAEYFFDTQGANGAGTALSAQDGSFNSVTENVTGSASVSGLTMGNHTLIVHGRDAANNWGAVLSISFNVTSAGDTSGPVTTALTVSPDPTAGATAVNITATVSDMTAGSSNISAAECFFDTQGTSGTGTVLTAQDGLFNNVTESVNGIVSVSGLSAGLHTVYVHGKDSSNNWGPFVSVTFTVSAGGGSDTLGPLTSGSSITPNPTLGAASAVLTTTISDANTGNSNIAAAEYFIDTQGAGGTGTALAAQDGTFSAVTEAVTGTVNISLLSAGSHTVFVHGRDALNNWGASQSVTLTVSAADTAGPITSGQNITPNPTAGAASVTLTATVSDVTTGGANIAAAEYFIDTQGANGTGTALSSQDGVFNSPNEAVTASISVASLSLGAHTVFVHGRDAFGNWGTAQSVSLTKSAADTTGPAASALNITPNPTAGALTVTLTASISEVSTGASNIAAAEYFIDTQGANGAGTALSAQDGAFNSTAETVTGSINVSLLSAGAHTVFVHGQDALNNWGAAQSISLTVSAAPDTTGPVSSSLNITPNPTAGATSAALTATVSDAAAGGSNITAAEYFVDTQGANGAGTALSAQDGAFNSASEAVTGSINVSALSVAAHTIYVHGRDALNNWGSAVTTTLTITAAAVKPDSLSAAIVHCTLSFTGNQPQEAVWIEDSVGAFVRTLFISSHASSNSSDLPTWFSKSGGVTNGTTGASKPSGSFNVNWTPPRNSAGTVVAPGTYRYRIAIRREGGGESTFTGNITLGNSAANSTATGGGFVTSFSADYTP
ncbi:MAG: DUF2271 domain-containing protein [Elusimicrobia bacterium]|nr:DUF2271 domain-containing protein [Candidatus Liberimonas magnetica]